jgi:hypothetical protein
MAPPLVMVGGAEAGCDGEAQITIVDNFNKKRAQFPANFHKPKIQERTFIASEPASTTLSDSVLHAMCS